MIVINQTPLLGNKGSDTVHMIDCFSLTTVRMRIIIFTILYFRRDMSSPAFVLPKDIKPFFFLFTLTHIVLSHVFCFFIYVLLCYPLMIYYVMLSY